MVGMVGFKPTTFAPQMQHSNQTELHPDFFSIEGDVC